MFGVKGIAGHATDIADTIDIDAVRGIGSAHINGVAGRRAAVFTGVEGSDAGNVLQRIGQVSHALIFHHLLGDHGDRTGGIGNRAGKFGVGRLRRGIQRGSLRFHHQRFTAIFFGVVCGQSQACRRQTQTHAGKDRQRAKTAER